MDPTTFDSITKLFASRRLSRRQAVTGSAGLAAGALAATGIDRKAEAAPTAPAARQTSRKVWSVAVAPSQSMAAPTAAPVSR